MAISNNPMSNFELGYVFSIFIMIVFPKIKINGKEYISRESIYNLVIKLFFLDVIISIFLKLVSN